MESNFYQHTLKTLKEMIVKAQESEHSAMLILKQSKLDAIRWKQCLEHWSSCYGELQALYKVMKNIFNMNRIEVYEMVSKP